MEQKSSAVKALTNGIAHLFKQNKVRCNTSVLVLFCGKNFMIISPNDRLHLQCNVMTVALQVTRVDGHGTITSPNEVHLSRWSLRIFSELYL